MYEINVACDAAYIFIYLTEISYNSAVYYESYTQKNLGGLLIMAPGVVSLLNNSVLLCMLNSLFFVS